MTEKVLVPTAFDLGPAANPACPHLPGHETHSPPCGLASQGLSAANPAACPDCKDFRQIVDPVPSHIHWLHERIRELEALCDGVVELKHRAEKAETRVKELEAQAERLRLRLMDAGIYGIRGEDGPDPDEKECLG